MGGSLLCHTVNHALEPTVSRRSAEPKGAEGCQARVAITPTRQKMVTATVFRGVRYCPSHILPVRMVLAPVSEKRLLSPFSCGV